MGFRMKDSKTAVSILLQLSKVGNITYVALDANVIELKEFGIDLKDFNSVADAIENFIQKLMENKK